MNINIMVRNSKIDIIVQNLKDAGCCDIQINEFIRRIQDGDLDSGLKLLEEHREQLLESFHKSKDCIDCLDYLVYKIGKEGVK